MKLSLKYLFGATVALFIISAIWINPVLALEVNPVQPAEAISYQEPVGVNSSLSATLPSYFFQGMHVGMLDGSGGVLFANGTIINVTRTKEGNHPVPITMGDDLRVDGEIWRGPKKGVTDNMPLKISDTMVPTMNDINDLGDSMRRWRNLYLSGTIFGNNAIFSGDIDFSNANLIGLSTTAFSKNENLLTADNNWIGINNFQNAVNFTGDVDFTGANVSGLTVSGEDLLTADNKIYISEDADSIIPVPSENPIAGKTLIGRTGFTCLGLSSWQEKDITLPLDFQTDETHYVVQVSEHLATGASHDYILEKINVETPSNSTLKIRVSCKSGETGIGLVDWSMVGY